MTRVLGRDDRRRRILSEARLSDSDGDGPTLDGHGHAPRYSPPAGSASFAIASRVLPTGAGSLSASVAALLLLTGALGAAGHYHAEIAEAAGPQVAGLIDPSLPTSLPVMACTVLGLAVAGLCGVVFGLRRHRSDDLRGVYRWWAVAAAAAMVVTIAMATGGHAIAAGIIAERVGWSPLPADAFWWLLPAAIVIGGLATRVFFDLKESRLTAAAAILSAVFCGIALAGGIGFALPIDVAEPVVTAAATQLAIGLAAVSLLAYSRRIVLEATGVLAAPAKREAKSETTEQGEEVELKPAPKPSRKAKAAASAATPAKPTLATSTASTSTSTKASTPKSNARATQPRTAAKKAEPAQETQWVDGSQGEMDDYGDEGTPRKLSKAERKRLRRQKARQNRAA